MAENRTATGFKVAVMMFVGFLCLAIIAVLTYFTIRTIAGRIDFCTLWTDIPGRLAILIISYYVAALCGYFPIPEHHFLDSLPEPVMLWRLETWREICTCFLIPNPFRRLSGSQRDAVESPLLRDGDTENLNGAPHDFIRQRSEPTPIIYPDERTNDRVAHESSPLPKNEIPVVSHGSSESFMSFGSPIAGFIVPGARTKSSRPHYLPSLEGATAQTLQMNYPLRTANEEIQLPDYSRCPWDFKRHPEDIDES